MTALLSESNAKTVKGLDLGWRTTGLAMLPHRLAGYGNVCSHSTADCRADCIQQSGHGSRDAVFAARKDRTRRFFGHRGRLLRDLADELSRFTLSCSRSGHRPAVRLNVFSDIPWERVAPELFSWFPLIQFYDYTKNPSRIERYAKGDRWPSNYHVTASWSVDDANDMRWKLKRANLAVPFFGVVPRVWKRRRTIDGDLHDLTFLHGRRGRIVGLVFKGKGGSRPTTGRFGVTV